MRIEDTFRVSRPIGETWGVLLDVERIAPCLPGAELHEVEGEEFRGVVKVKVGPISAQYKGAARLAEVDEGQRRVVIDASGRDTRGAGNAKASIVVTMREDGDGTAVAIDTDLSITGKVAQLGRGMLADVSAKLLAQFAENLERDVLGPEPGATAPPEPSAASDTAGSAEAAPAGPRSVTPRPAEPVDLVEVAGAPVAKRALPALLVLLVLVLVWRRRRGRRRP